MTDGQFFMSWFLVLSTIFVIIAEICYKIGAKIERNIENKNVERRIKQLKRLKI